MKKLYMIAEKNTNIESEDSIIHVRAIDENDAIFKYAKDYYSQSPLFANFVEDKCINGGFWEQFYFNGIFKYKNGDVVTHLTDQEVCSQFEKNILTFLNHDEKLANELVGFYNNNQQLYDLSKELIYEMAYQTVLNDYQSGYIIVKEINI